MSQRSDRFRGSHPHESTAVLVAIQLPPLTEADVAAPLSELERLVSGLGIRVLHTTLQKRVNATSPGDPEGPFRGPGGRYG